MEEALESGARLLVLAFPALLGALAGRAGLFGAPEEAQRALNGYALAVGFPALIAASLARAPLALPGSAWFWLLWPAALALLLLLIRVLGPRGERGTLALSACFGNVAYLGLPYVVAREGAALEGPAALAASIHVLGAVTLGPWLLGLWGAGAAQGWKARLGELARMPLLWAPLVGLGLRALGPGPREGALSLLGPVGASAAPVALFVLGLHLHRERRRLWSVDAGLWRHVAVAQVLAPGLVLLLGWAAWRWGGLPAAWARAHVALASMPVAITTFAIAQRVGVGEDRVAAVIVWSALLSLVWLPLWGACAGWVLG